MLRNFEWFTRKIRGGLLNGINTLEINQAVPSIHYQFYMQENDGPANDEIYRPENIENTVQIYNATIEEYKKILMHLNAGLIDISTRLPLFVREVTIDLKPDKDLYVLRDKRILMPKLPYGVTGTDFVEYGNPEGTYVNPYIYTGSIDESDAPINHPDSVVRGSAYAYDYYATEEYPPIPSEGAWGVYEYWEYPDDFPEYESLKLAENVDVPLFVRPLKILDSKGIEHLHNVGEIVEFTQFNKIKFDKKRMSELGDKVTVKFQGLHKPLKDFGLYNRPKMTGSKLFDGNSSYYEGSYSPVFETLTSYDAEYYKLSESFTATDLIDLPPSLEDALEYYVAGKYLLAHNDKTLASMGDLYLGKYNELMTECIISDLASTSDMSNNKDYKFISKGFV